MAPGDGPHPARGSSLPHPGDCRPARQPRIPQTVQGVSSGAPGAPLGSRLRVVQAYYLCLFHPNGPCDTSHFFNKYLVSTWYVPGRCESPSPPPPALRQRTSRFLPLISLTQTLCRGGWKASFAELHDVDHFEILWNLTQEDYVLTQVVCIPSLWTECVLA